MMELGGNGRFNKFLAEHDIPQDMPVREKYSTRAAEWYRKNLSALAEGLQSLPPLPHGTGHLPMDASPSSMKHILDEVFAESPHRGSMTLGGVHQLRTSKEIAGAASSKVNAKSICEQLSDCFRLKRQSTEASQSHSSPSATESFDSLAPSGSFTRLPTLLGSQDCPNAKRLHTLSSGKMEGFGSTDLPSKFLLPHKACHVAA
jgi:hypothetical protein